MLQRSLKPYFLLIPNNKRKTFNKYAVQTDLEKSSKIISEGNIVSLIIRCLCNLLY